MNVATLKVQNSYCYLIDCTPEMVDGVKDRLTYKNESAEYELFSKKKLLGSRRAQANHKFKYVLKKEIAELEKLVEVCWLDLSGDCPKFPTGHLKIVQEYLDECGFDYGMYDQREVPEAYNFFGWKVQPPELRYYQKAIVEAAEKHHRGIFESCVGSGKTLCMVNVVKLLEVNTLVVVPSLGLLEQIFDEFNTYLGGKHVQKVTTDVVKKGKAYKAIRIVTAQTLASLQKNELLTKLVEDIDCLMIDEVHHSGAKTFTDLLPEIDHIYYRFGFSGTWVRSDAKELDMWGFLSGKLYEYPSRQAISDGFLTPVSYHTIALPGINKRNYQAEYKANYCSNFMLFEKINDLIQEEIPSDHQVLILVDQKELGGKVLHEFLIKNHVEATYMSGDTKKTEFKDTIKAFNNKDIRVLIATKVLGEGIDIKSTQHLILANGGKSVVKLVQGIGRCVRLYPDKKHSYVWDFNFLDTSYMHKHFNERLRIFEEEFNGDVLEG